MSKQKNIRQLICLFCVVVGILFFNTKLLQSADKYEDCDLGVSLTADSTEQDAFLGKTLKWDKIVVKKTKNAPISNEYKEGKWSIIVYKIKVEHRYSSDTTFQAKPKPTPAPIDREGLSFLPVPKATEVNLEQIQFTPEKAGYTRETYRVFITVPKLLKSNNQHAKDSNGNWLWWSSFADITITYNVPEFKLVAVKFTSDHGMLRPDAYNYTPNCYDIGNMQTYNTIYLNGTLQTTLTRNASGKLVETITANVPITHSWKHADPNKKIEYTIKLKNFGATIKEKIYLGDTRPQDTNLLWTLPSEGESKDYNISCSNDNGVIGYKTFTQQLTFRRETTNEVIATSSFTQNVYWTFGTPQIDINDARMNLAVGNVFSGQTETDTKQILEDMLSKKGVVMFNVENNISGTLNELRNWNRLKEDGIDCISHSEFFQKIIKASGMPVSAGVQTYIASYALNAEPKRTETPIEGNFNWRVDVNDNILQEPGSPLGGGQQAVNAIVFPLIQNELTRLGQHSKANLIFGRGTGLENFESVIILRDNKTNKVYYNPGGTRDVHDENQRKKIITNMMNFLYWRFWKKYDIIDPATNQTITITKVLDTLIVDYTYTRIP